MKTPSQRKSSDRATDTPTAAANKLGNFELWRTALRKSPHASTSPVIIENHKSVDFEVWASCVRQQMLAVVRKQKY